MASKTPAAEPPPELSGHFRRMQATEDVTRALLSRPRLSLRMQLLLGFLVVFLFAAGIATAIIISIYRVEQKVKFLEIVNDYVLEIDEARRHEKNYFLYGTNLGDALDSVHRAKGLLQGRSQQLARVIGSRQVAGIWSNIGAYEKLLQELVKLDRRAGGAPGARQRTEYASRVRRQGQRMVRLARQLMNKERVAIEAAVAGSRRIQIYSLVFLLIFMISTAVLISGNIVRSIVRFESYAQRIAAGDFTPIGPVRKYRDEFTQLVLAINRMMIDLQKHEAMLIQAHKMRAIGTLTAGVAHELNNPLNNITLTSEMLLEDFDELDAGEQREMVSDVVREAERAKNIVSNLLDFTRESETRLEPLDLVQLVRSTIALVHNQVKIAGIKVELNAMDTPPPILGDSQQLTQVFVNLILNAVQASERGGKIQVLVHPADRADHLSVKIIDYGTGMPKHILTRIFDPFFTTKDKGQGTGLGLSVSQGIIAKHNGRMLVDSREGRGSTFTVILPVTTVS
jgi:signal transduction histidine kinase